MDYRTFFFTNIATVTVFAACVCLLAWRNRTIGGMRWFAGSLVLALVKLVLQGLEGKVPPVLGSMVPNELYLISSLMQLIGLHWFVVRRPFRFRWPLLSTGAALAVYTWMFLGRVPYSGNVINLPNVAVCLTACWMLLINGQRAVSRIAAAVLFCQAMTMGYRAWLTNMRYTRPWETQHAQTDPRWLYSLALLAFLATCMVMCDLWYLVIELGRVLEEQARTDSLTGALNRRALEEVARHEAARSMRHGHPLCMIVLDIDHFKHLNDTRGHAAGDCALQALVRQVTRMLRSSDAIARTGGEEFTILLPDTPMSAAIHAAERVRQSIEALDLQFEGEPLRITVSAGVAQLEPGRGSWESMMRSADSAMYEAKQKGRNSVWPALDVLGSDRLPSEVGPAV
jgi:diguanylate cyclase (GGDEF)-like protein